MASAEATDIRTALARRVSNQFARETAIRAAILTGSTARGIADDASDLDVVLFYDSAPSTDSLNEIRLALGGDRLLFAVGDPVEGSFVQSFLLDGIKTDVAHVALAKWREDVSDVLVRFNPDSPMQKALSGLLDSIPLIGQDLIESLRREAEYPDGLAAAVINKHLRFYPPWALREQAADRRDTLYFHELLTGEISHLIHVLCGVNRIYHFGETKHSDHLLGRLKVAPSNCRETLPRLFGITMSDAAGELDRLIRETFEIVQSEMPNLDISRAVARYETPGNG